MLATAASTAGLDALLQGHRVGAGGDVAQALADHAPRQHRCGRGAVTGDVVGLLGDFLDQLGADPLVRILEVDLLGDRHAVVGDGGSAPLLLQHDVAALWPERDAHRVGELVHASLERAASLLVECDHFRHCMCLHDEDMFALQCERALDLVLTATQQRESAEHSYASRRVLIRQPASRREATSGDVLAQLSCADVANATWSVCRWRGGRARRGVGAGPAGTTVTVFERDATPMPSVRRRGVRLGSPRRAAGAAQPRLPGPAGRVLLKTDYPDVSPQLLDEGATEMRFGDDLPPTMVGFEREPGDDELVDAGLPADDVRVGAAPRALAEGRVEFRTGVAVDGSARRLRRRDRAAHHGRPARRRHASRQPISSSSPPAGAARCPTGSTTIGARPSTRRSTTPGIVYFSRFYRLRDGVELPAARPVRSAATSATSSTACSSATTARSRSRWRRRPTTTSCARC